MAAKCFKLWSVAGLGHSRGAAEETETQTLRRQQQQRDQHDQRDQSLGWGSSSRDRERVDEEEADKKIATIFPFIYILLELLDSDALIKRYHKQCDALLRLLTDILR